MTLSLTRSEASAAMDKLTVDELKWCRGLSAAELGLVLECVYRLDARPVPYDPETAEIPF